MSQQPDPLFDFDRTQWHHDTPFQSPQQRTRDLERFMPGERLVLDVFNAYQVELKALQQRHREETTALLAEWQPAIDQAVRWMVLP